MNKLIILVIIFILLLIYILSKSTANFITIICKNLNLNYKESINRCRQDCNSDNNCNHIIKDYLEN